MSELKPCPFCGATPHTKLSKVWHDQLHGDPHQDTIIKCPRGHARAASGDSEAARNAWNTRSPTAALDVVIEAVRKRKNGLAYEHGGITLLPKHYAIAMLEALKEGA